MYGGVVVEVNVDLYWSFKYPIKSLVRLLISLSLPNFEKITFLSGAPVSVDVDVDTFV